MYDVMSELRLTCKSLQRELEEGKRARHRLESQIQKLLSAAPRKYLSINKNLPFYKFKL